MSAQSGFALAAMLSSDHTMTLARNARGRLHTHQNALALFAARWTGMNGQSVRYVWRQAAWTTARARDATAPAGSMQEVNPSNREIDQRSAKPESLLRTVTDVFSAVPANFRFSNRPFEVKHFQTIHHCSVDVAHGLALLFGIGTRALPSWDSRTRWNNLLRGL